MPDLDAVYDELTRRLARHEPDFRRTNNPTDANTARSRKERAAEPDPGSYLLLGAADGEVPRRPDVRRRSAGASGTSATT